MKILVVEDEAGMRENIQQSLLKEKYVVETAADFFAASEKIGVYEYDCILLDIGLPGGNGLALLEELKATNKTDGVIIISAKNSLEDKIHGLDLGADDYLAKPFHLAELHARVKSVLRRKKADGNRYMSLGNLRLDPDQRSVSVAGATLELNRKEFDVLQYLLANANRLVSKSALAEHVWGDHMDMANSFEFVYSQIRNLRRKLKEKGSTAGIQAIYGVGYKLVEE